MEFKLNEKDFDLNQFEEYREANGTLQRLRGLRDSWNQRIIELHQRVDTRSQNRKEQRVAELINRARTGDPQPLDDELPQTWIGNEIAKLYKGLHESEQAIAAVEKELGDIRAKCSQNILEAQRPVYIDIQRRRREALLALAAVSIEEQQFADAMRTNDVSWGTLSRCCYPQIGRPDDPASNVSRWVAEIDHDYPEITGKQKPKDTPKASKSIVERVVPGDWGHPD